MGTNRIPEQAEAVSGGSLKQPKGPAGSRYMQ